jgi:hypothetical protein
MANGETAWLVRPHEEMTPKVNGPISDAERQFRGFKVSGGLDSIGAWGLWVTTSENGLPLLVQIPLGKRHFTSTAEA